MFFLLQLGNIYKRGGHMSAFMSLTSPSSLRMIGARRRDNASDGDTQKIALQEIIVFDF